MKLTVNKAGLGLLPVFLIGSIFILTSPKKDLIKKFEIKGKFIGKNTKEIILYYSDANLNTQIDTLKIQEDGTFSTIGTVNGFTSANIEGDMLSNSVEDPNYVHIYIEEGVNEITLKENDFKNVTIKNKTFEEYKKFLELLDPVYKKQGPLIQKRNSLYADHLVFPKDLAVKNEMDSLTRLIQINSKLKDDITLNYIKTNRNSYLSAVLLERLFKANKLNLDEVRKYYEDLALKARKSNHGLVILKLFQKIEKTLIGNKAADFETIDNKGNRIKLSDFKGKYVLLDFWAGWCKPCKKNHPEMKAVYNEYHDKGVEFIGVSFDRGEEEWKESIVAENLQGWHHVLGNYRDTDENAIHNKFNVMPIPAYILIDDKGYIVGRYLGADRFDGNENGRDGIPELKKKLQMVFSGS